MKKLGLYWKLSLHDFLENWNCIKIELISWPVTDYWEPCKSIFYICMLDKYFSAFNSVLSRRFCVFSKSLVFQNSRNVDKYHERDYLKQFSKFMLHKLRSNNFVFSTFQLQSLFSSGKLFRLTIFSSFLGFKNSHNNPYTKLEKSKWVSQLS